MQVSYLSFPVIFALGILQASWCHPLSITAVRFDPAAKGENFKKADVEFSKSIEVKGMEVSLEKDNPFVRLPLTPSQGDRGYSNIRILSKRMYDLLLALPRSGRYRVSSMPSIVLGSNRARAVTGPAPHAGQESSPASALSYRISSARRLSSPYRIANVEVEFDGDLIVTFGLMRSKFSGYWVSCPKSFRIINRRLKKDVKKAVISEGLKAIKTND